MLESMTKKKKNLPKTAGYQLSWLILGPMECQPKALFNSWVYTPSSSFKKGQFQSHHPCRLQEVPWTVKTHTQDNKTVKTLFFFFSKKAFTGLIEVISQGKCQILVLPRPLEQLQIRMVWSLLPVAK